MLPYNKNLKQFSRALRKDMTDAERLLWSKLRGQQSKYQFYRQRIIGNFIVDFYCPKARLVIELDGGQHYEDDVKESDMARDAFMSELGLNVLRFSDRDVFTHLEAVLEEIWSRL